jgi:hypothetical protein
MNTLKYGIAIFISLLAVNVSAWTRAEYQFTDGKEVIFFSTVAENPNIEKMKNTAKQAGFEEFSELTMQTVDDVWCLIETHTKNPLLRLMCYQPHKGGFSVNDDYDTSRKGYEDLMNAIHNLREKLRMMLNRK